MKKSILFLILFSTFITFLHGTEYIIVKQGTSCSTLKDAYDKIVVNSNNEVTEDYYILIDGEVLIKENTQYGFKWKKSGTFNNRIFIKSRYGTSKSTLCRSNNDIDRGSTLVGFHNVEWIVLSNLNFTDALNILRLESSHNIHIYNCNFYVGEFNADYFGGSAPITIAHINWQNDDDPDQSSNNIIEGNTIVYNYDHIDSFTNNLDYSPNMKFFHGIYLAHSDRNIIRRNIIYNAPGGGIHSYHNYTTNNLIEGNEIYKINNIGSRNKEKFGIILAGEKFVTGNIVRYNKIWTDVSCWVSSSYHDFNGYTYNRHDIVVEKSYNDNTFKDNYISYGNDNPYTKVFDLPNNEYFVVKGKTIYKKKEGVELGNQKFYGNINDVEYAGGYTFIGFSNGKIIKLLGTGTNGNVMFNVSESSSGFTHIYPYTHHLKGYHMFQSAITDITYISGKLFVAFTNKKVLKINGIGSSGNNLFAIQETSTGFNGLSGYNYYSGDAKFNYSYVRNIKYDDINTYLTFSNNKVLKINSNGGSGHNMFVVSDSKNSFYHNPSTYYPRYMLGYQDLKYSGWLVLKGATYIPSWINGLDYSSYNSSTYTNNYPKNKDDFLLKSKSGFNSKDDYQDSEENTFILYPNPSTGVFTIEMSSDSNISKIQILNSCGKKIYDTSIIENKMEFNLANNIPGMYLIHVISDKHVSSKKIILKK